jgi:hypothetical protein
MEDQRMSIRKRPLQATIYSALLAGSGLFMMWLGTMASAYYVPGVCLLLLALLLWNGRAPKLFERLLTVNQATAILLLVVLLTGIADALHLPKLDISGVLLLANLLTGGPLAGILAIPLLASLHFGKALRDWFDARAAGAASTLVGARAAS